MPTTTTLKLPDALKARILPLAQAKGQTPHAWMLWALESQVSLSEARQSFLDAASQSAAEVDAGAPLFAMQDVHEYIHALSTGTKAKRPAPMRPSRRAKR